MYKLSLIILFFCSMIRAEENPSLNYISQYKEISIQEMHRSGIPASIKMAQALLESGAGKSTLAREANNHFGIKCGGGWNGKTFYRKDDDYNSKGELIKSCFRKFKKTEDSYIAHSEFLTTQRRYAFLFDLHKKDYHAWAHGLRKAGYATDKKYPQKLIDIIEKYQLYLLDDESDGILAVDEPHIDQPIFDGKTENTAADSSAEEVVVASNSRKQKRKSKRNKKRSKIEDKNPTEHIVSHRVMGNQTIAEIAMIYDLSENALRIRNRLPKDAEPLEGEKIYLRKKISLLKRPRFSRQPLKDALVADGFIF